MEIELLEGHFAVARLDPAEPVPAWASSDVLMMLARTTSELSILCPEDQVPDGARKEGGFRAIRVTGPLDFGAIGVVSALAAPLARAGVAILVTSTFDTDYVFVRESDLERAVAALRDAGHRFGEPRAEAR